MKRTWTNACKGHVYMVSALTAGVTLLASALLVSDRDGHTDYSTNRSFLFRMDGSFMR